MARVEPRLRQVGSQIIETATGNRVYLRGFGNEVESQTTKTLMEQTFGLLPGANFCTIRFTQSSGEPNHPTGSAPSWVHTWDATIFARGVAMMQWCEDNHRYFVVRTGHHGADGSSFLGHSSGTPNWFYDSSLWGAGTAPLPADRANYLSDYSGAFDDDVDTASWVPLAGDPLLTAPNHLCRGKFSGGSGKNWGGDADALYYLYGDWYQHLVEVSQVFSYCVGYNFFNEPDIGALNDTNNFNEGSTHIKSVERMIKTQAVIYDRLRVIEPTRWFSTHGEGGPNWTQSPNFAYYWDPTGATAVCPSDHHFAHEAHFYMSGQATYSPTPGSYDTTATGFNQNSLNTTQTVFQIDLPGITGTNSFSLKLPGASSGSPTTTFVRGTNLTAAAIQTACRALQVGGSPWDAALTVTGTTDSGPFTVTLPTNTTNIKRLQIATFSPQIYGGFLPDVSYPDNFPGKLNDKDCYSPLGTNVNDTVKKVHDKMTARGIPMIVGEYGIDEDVFNGDQYISDMDTALRQGFDHSTIFVANVGDSDGILDEFTSNVYTLNHLGAKLKTILDAQFGANPVVSVVGATSKATQSASDSLSLPPGAAAGDHVVLVVEARAAAGSAGFTFTQPAGYSPIGAGTPAGHAHCGSILTLACFVKQLVTAEADTGTVSGMGTVSNFLSCLVLRGVQGLDQVEITADTGVPDTTPTAATLTSSRDGSIIVSFAGQSQSSTVTTEVPSFTQQLHDRIALVGGNLCTHIATLLQASAGATGSLPLVLSGSGRWVAGAISFTPAATTGGGGGAIADVGIGEGHIDTDTYFSTTRQQACANGAVMIGGPGAMLRTDVSTGQITVGESFPNSYWLGLGGRNTLCTADGAAGARYFGTLHLGMNTPLPPFKTVGGFRRAPEWYNYCFCAAQRYGPPGPGTGSFSPNITPFSAPGWTGITRWEILNEPNGPSGGRISAADAWVMIREAVEAINQVAGVNNWPELHITAPALAGVFDPIKYLQDLNAAAVTENYFGQTPGNILQRVGIHVYMNHWPTAIPKPGTIRVDELGDLQALRNAMDAMGMAGLELAISEGGYSGDDAHNQWTNGPGDMVYATQAAVDALPAAQRPGKFASGPALAQCINIIAQHPNWKVTLITPYRALRRGPGGGWDYAGDNSNGTNFWRDNLALLQNTNTATPTLREAGTYFKNALTAVNTAPIGQITSPPGGTSVIIATTTLAATWTDPDGIFSAEYRAKAGGGAFGAWTPMTVTLDHGDGTVDFTAVVPVTLSGGAGTTNTYEVRATDNSASHLVSGSLTVNVQGVSPIHDVTPPTLTVSAPAGNITLTGDPGTRYTVTGQATDTNGCGVTVNGLPVALDGSGNFTTSLILSSGFNQVLVVAIDPPQADGSGSNVAQINRTITLESPEGGGGDVIVVSADLDQIHIRVVERGISS